MQGRLETEQLYMTCDCGECASTGPDFQGKPGPLTEVDRVMTRNRGKRDWLAAGRADDAAYRFFRYGYDKAAVLSIANTAKCL